MIDFRIETFLEACKWLNYTKASKELNITQPAVSQHIRYLEEVYQTKLFFYHNKKIGLTEAGKLLKQAALTMKHDEQNLKKRIAQLGNQVPELNFGVTLTVGEYCIPKKIASYMKTNRNLKVSMFVDNTNNLLDKLSEGVIDFAIVEGNFPKQEYEYAIYESQECIPVCATSHRFAKEPEKLEELLQETLIIREKDSGGREIIERCLDGKNLSLGDFHNYMEVSSIKTIKELVKEDGGITFLYEAAVKEELETEVLKRIYLKDFQMVHDMMFIFQKNSIYAEEYQKIYHMLKEE